MFVKTHLLLKLKWSNSPERWICHDFIRWLTSYPGYIISAFLCYFRVRFGNYPPLMAQSSTYNRLLINYISSTFSLLCECVRNNEHSSYDREFCVYPNCWFPRYYIFSLWHSCRLIWLKWKLSLTKRTYMLWIYKDIKKSKIKRYKLMMKDFTR